MKLNKLNAIKSGFWIRQFENKYTISCLIDTRSFFFRNPIIRSVLLLLLHFYVDPALNDPDPKSLYLCYAFSVEVIDVNKNDFKIDQHLAPFFV